MRHEELHSKYHGPPSHEDESPLTRNSPIIVIVVSTECTLNSKTDGSTDVCSYLGPGSRDTSHLRGAVRDEVDAERLDTDFSDDGRGGAYELAK